tara:strand:+ start:3061 stop:3831 length:771 start_codon:yes stop_codon:yes gene_type:complete
MANGGYNPFTFATGLTQLAGQRGLQGMVSGVQDKYQDLESIKDYIRQSGAKIGDVLAYGGRTDVQAKLGGIAGTAILQKLGMKGATSPLLGFAVPHAALLAGLGAGLYSYFRKKGKQKDISNLAALAPKVKYGMSNLKEAVSDIDESVSSIREGILPSALSTGINVPIDVLKMQFLKDQFGKLSTGVGDEVSNIATGDLSKQFLAGQQEYRQKGYGDLLSLVRQGATSGGDIDMSQSPYQYSSYLKNPYMRLNFPK